jgi:hypothetical protein
VNDFGGKLIFKKVSVKGEKIQESPADEVVNFINEKYGKGKTYFENFKELPFQIMIPWKMEKKSLNNVLKNLEELIF